MLFNGLYTQRRVPRERDGRTNEEKAKPEYREFRSLWYEVDEDKMYSEARGLRDAGFPGWRWIFAVLLRGKSRSQAITTYLFKFFLRSIAKILPTDLKWSVDVSVPESYGRTIFDKADPSQWSFPRCTISANLIWPLLAYQYTESEKVGYRVQIAQTMLHELTVSNVQSDGGIKLTNID